MLRPATPRDWSAITGMRPPSVWSGIADAGPHLVHGLGGIYLAEDGRWWVFFHRTPGVRKVKTAHKSAKILLGSAREAGITVHAVEDDTITGAAVWLERLGFEMTDERLGGLRVWQIR